MIEDASPSEARLAISNTAQIEKNAAATKILAGVSWTLKTMAKLGSDHRGRLLWMGISLEHYLIHDGGNVL